jgi:hypothetical protein
MDELEKKPRGRAALALAALLALMAGPGTVSAQVQAKYLYGLSSFTGTVPYDWARVSVDEERGETYVIYRNIVRIFNRSGMETFSFGDDLDLGLLTDVAVDGRGDIILLSYKDSRPLLTRCNFRGVPIGPFEIEGLPASLAFGANRMIFRNDRFYFASLSRGTVIVTDAGGKFLDHIDLFALVEADARQKVGAEMFGFSVDGQGNIFFSVPVLFKVFKLSPDKQLASFGRPGSVAGRFGIVAGVVADSRGHVIVADKLKCVVMVFDKDFNFLTEFGMRGLRPENLIIPDEVAIDKEDRIYVTQGRKRGVSVFALASE